MGKLNTIGKRVALVTAIAYPAALAYQIAVNDAPVLEKADAFYLNASTQSPADFAHRFNSVGHNPDQTPEQAFASELSKVTEHLIPKEDVAKLYGTRPNIVKRIFESGVNYAFDDTKTRAPRDAKPFHPAGVAFSVEFEATGGTPFSSGIFQDDMTYSCIARYSFADQNLALIGQAFACYVPDGQNGTYEVDIKTVGDAVDHDIFNTATASTGGIEVGTVALTAGLYPLAGSSFFNLPTPQIVTTLPVNGESAVMPEGGLATFMHIVPSEHSRSVAASSKVEALALALSQECVPGTVISRVLMENDSTIAHVANIKCKAPEIMMSQYLENEKVFLRDPAPLLGRRANKAFERFVQPTGEDYMPIGEGNVYSFDGGLARHRSVLTVASQE